MRNIYSDQQYLLKSADSLSHLDHKMLGVDLLRF